MDWKNKPNQIFNKVKNQMFAKGVQNFYFIDKIIQEFDPDNSGVLNPHYFNLFSNKVGFFLTTQQIRTVTEFYAKQDKQRIHYKEFLEDIKYSISQKILSLINQAFDKMKEKQVQNQVSIERLQNLYLAQKHPKVVTRTIAAQYAREMFVKGMERKAVNGKVSKQKFIDYYAQLNFCIPLQRQTVILFLTQYFRNLLISTWSLGHSDDYVSQDRLREMQLVLYEKIREKSDGKQSEWKTAKKVLAYFDLDDIGKCDFSQFKKALDMFGCTFKDNQTQALFNKYDPKRCGYIDQVQFSKAIMNIDISGMSSKPNLFQQTMGKHHFTLTK